MRKYKSYLISFFYKRLPAKIIYVGVLKKCLNLRDDKGMRKNNRLSVVGTSTNNVIYEQLAPDILEEFKKIQKIRVEIKKLDIINI